jgi:hypothetical protein
MGIERPLHTPAGTSSSAPPGIHGAIAYFDIRAPWIHGAIALSDTRAPWTPRCNRFFPYIKKREKLRDISRVSIIDTATTSLHLYQLPSSSQYQFATMGKYSVSLNGVLYY